MLLSRMPPDEQRVFSMTASRVCSSVGPCLCKPTEAAQDEVHTAVLKQQGAAPGKIDGAAW